MTQGGQSLHLLGSKVSTSNNMTLDVNATNAVQHLKQEVIRLQNENTKLTDQLNCFISLVQRSWKGDAFATTHLSNIVGLDPPKKNSGPKDGTQARPNSQIDVQSRSHNNWERLAKKLLDREYQAVQEEIREYQQRYIQNRQLYMDAVLNDHQQSMSALSRKPNSSHNVEGVDARFIKHTKAIERLGISRRQTKRAQSSKIRRQLSAQDQVRGMDISLRDLVGETPSSNHFTDTEASNEPYTITPSQNLRRRPQTAHVKRYRSNTYNDPNRYAEGNMFGVKDTEIIRKTRPVSASSLQGGDNIRSRPRTGSAGKLAKDSSTFITQKNERSLKYEATKPVYTRPKSSKPKIKTAENMPSSVLKRSNSHTSLTAQTDIFRASTLPFSKSDATPIELEKTSGTFKHEAGMPSVEDTPWQYVDDKSTFSEDPSLPPKPAISVRVKSAFTRRPAHIDEFAEEESQMRQLEEDFKKTALGLQKKLGIADKGMVIFE